ncbi:hypothetical protein [Kallotenue papyrolyticum]|uniref:hypothetical protein n=1 Tax=Kallotenue papyrolyticum TaxID=1325125 RepID=UPI0004786435|nr:hypothetical protein [Kallotenue papyrolyticum]
MTHNRANGALACAWCGFSGALQRLSDHVHISNAQLAMQHTVWRCPQCEGATATAPWGAELRFRYRVIEYRRRWRRSVWVAIYEVTCAWCGAQESEALEINVTVANPVSERLRYDVYGCRRCGRATALSYLGALRTHRAVRDAYYDALWYLDPDDSVA